MIDFARALNDSLTACGLPAQGRFLVDDKIHRFKSPPDHSDNSWYILHQVGDIVVGGFGDWRRDISKVFYSRNRESMSREEQGFVALALKKIRETQLAEEKANHDKVRQKCAELFAKAPRAKEHAYLTAKGVQASNSSVISNYVMYPGWLAVPLQDIEGTVHSAQFIDANGDKRFFYEGRVRGCYHQFSDVNHNGPVIICEGYATGASLYMSTHWTVACAMNCGNLEAVARDFRRKFQDRTILIAADNDQFTEGNPGLTKAKIAADNSKALLTYPEFGDEALAEKPTDFNDLHRLAGLPEVTRQVHHAFPTLRILCERLFNPRIAPPPLKTVYSLQDKTISTPGNLSSITSKVKTGKTACICAMMGSAFPCESEQPPDFLGFSSSNPKNLAIVHIDSEQSPDDHWHQIFRILRRCNLKTPPPWFYSYCLTGLSFKEAKAAFLEALRMCADKHGGIHSSFIDGICDLVSDVNDAAEANAFVAELQDNAIHYTCPIVGVIHINPSSEEKTRGHLGSQFERKSETNLRLDKKDEITTIWSDKQRRAPIPKGSGPSFRWDDDLEMHSTCEPPPESENKGGRPSIVQQIASMNSHDFVTGCVLSGETRSGISRRLESWLAAKSVDASFDTCRRAVVCMVSSGKLRKDPITGLYFKGSNA